MNRVIKENRDRRYRALADMERKLENLERKRLYYYMRLDVRNEAKIRSEIRSLKSMIELAQHWDEQISIAEELREDRK